MLIYIAVQGLKPLHIYVAVYIKTLKCVAQLKDACQI